MNDAYLKAVSTHTFLWAFNYNGSDFWLSKQVWCSDHAFMEASGNDYMDAYMMAQYFNAQARDIFIGPIKDTPGKTQSPCERYFYNQEVIRELKYWIKTSDGKIFELPIHAVRLYLFKPFRVGVLSIEVYNTEYSSLDDIQLINDLGRRIRLPFLPRTQGGFILCADQIGIIHGEDHRWVTDFRELAENTLASVGSGTSLYREKSLEPADFIYGFLSGQIGKSEMQGGLPEKLVPESDDRMFLVSMIRNEEISSSIKNWRNLVSEDSRRLYSVVFADPNSYPTCQDEKMRTELLEKAVYPRWSHEGTLYAVTNLSVMCLTDDNESIVDSVYRPFLTEYTAMALLVLVQRVSIECFARESSGIVQGAQERGLLKQEQIEDMINLHERYVTWQNEINLFEVTDQEQGIEMYERMREQMGVNARIGYLAEQLEDMYAIANVNQNTRTNQSVVWWAFVAIVFNILLSLASFLLELTESGKGFEVVGDWHQQWWSSIGGIIQPLSIGPIIVSLILGVFVFPLAFKKSKRRMFRFFEMLFCK